MLVLGLFFTGMLILFKTTGLITVEKIELWLAAAKNVNSFYVALVVVILLFADLFIAVPTLTITLLAGFFIGPIAGALSAISGMLLAGVCGYVISRIFGDKLIHFLIKDQQEREEAILTFRKHGAIVILLARAAPVLPEVSACMAGMTGMSFLKFLFFWLLSLVPYAIIASYAGSISTLENPTPAIFTAVGFTIFFGLLGLLLEKGRSDFLIFT